MMPAINKRVNIKTTVAVRNTNPPICGTVKDVIMPVGEILKCLCKRAIVDEILPDGTTVRLTLRNYLLDNGAGLDASKNAVAAVPVKPIVTQNHKKEKIKEGDNDDTEKEEAGIQAFEGSQEVVETGETDSEIRDQDAEEIGKVCEAEKEEVTIEDEVVNTKAGESIDATSGYIAVEYDETSSDIGFVTTNAASTPSQPRPKNNNHKKKKR